MKRIYPILLSILLIIICWRCSNIEDTTNNEDLVFSDVFEISIPPYQYENDGIIYQVTGDTGYYYSLVDTLNSEPSFRWDSLDISLVTVAIFNQPINVYKGAIVNTGNLIWQWHSGMESGKEGNIQYSDGRNVLYNDEASIDYFHPARPLDEGHYFWAVWGWNRSGVKVWYSSRQLEFYVTD